MKIALAAYEFKNNDLEFNLSQIEKALSLCKGKADLLCFGESFLQGFDALSWHFETDQTMAISQDSEIMLKLCDMTLTYQVDLGIGYFEKEHEIIYSAYAVIEKGRIIHNYRRITPNWKEIDKSDEHYQEGSETCAFWYHHQKMMIALCGDLWIKPERFVSEGVLLWPIYVNFDLAAWKENLDDYAKQADLAAWKENLDDYAKQADLAAKRTLLVNSISHVPKAIGNAFYFEEGKIKKQLNFDQEDLLIAEV